MAKAGAKAYKGAIQDCSYVLRGPSPDSGFKNFSNGYISRGNAYLQLGNYQEACVDFNMAAKPGEEKATSLLS